MINHAIIARDPSGLIIGWNAEAERLLQYGAAEIVGRPIQTVIPQADLDELQRMEERVRDNRRVAPIRIRHVSKDGETRVLDVSVALTLAPDGAVAMITQFASAPAADRRGGFTNRTALEFGDAMDVEERERRLLQVIDPFPQLIWRSTTEGQVNLLTSGWKEFTGRSEGALVGEGWLEVMHPEDRDRFFACWREATSKLSAGRCELRLQRGDGRYDWMEMRTWPILGRQGNVIGWIGSFTNINAMREAQRELLEQRERFERVAASVPGAIYEFRLRPDGDVSFPFVSAGIKDILPVSAEELTTNTHSLEPFMHPQDVQRINTAIAYSAEHLTTFRCEFRINHPGKGELWVEARSVPVREPDGGTLWFGIIFDSTDHKCAEEQLRLSQARLQAAIDAGGVGTWIRDLQTETLWWDDTALRIWGRTAAEVNGRPSRTALDFVHPDDRAWVLASSRESVHSKEIAAAEFRVIRADGAIRWVAINGVIERNAQGVPVRMIGACIDTTLRKQQEESQRRSQRLEALGTLAGGIAHDFNNILLAITGNARMAMAELPSENPASVSVREIDKAAARATSLVQRILAFSRQTEPKREVLQLQPTVEEALKLLRSTLPAMIEIRTRFAPGAAPSLRADSTQIHQVVTNLVTNAAYAIGEQAGVVTVSIDTASSPKDVASYSPPMTSGRYVRLSVTDTGVGMPPETVDRIFDPFFTTKPIGQGTGLGLSVVHGIVRSHGGAITVESAPGKGSTFRVYFPAAKSAEHRQPQAHDEPAQGHGQRVMYVDDEDALVYLLTRKLEKLGYTVAGFTDPAAAVNAFRAQPDAFDVVVTDMSMPGMSGFHFAKAILDIRGATPVVMTSGYVRPQDREAALALGVREVIMKPNTIDELGQVLAAMFEATPKSART